MTRCYVRLAAPHWIPPTGDTLKLMHCVPSLPPGRLVAVPGAGLLRVPHVDPALLAEKAAAEADSSLAVKLMAHVDKKDGVSLHLFCQLQLLVASAGGQNQGQLCMMPADVDGSCDGGMHSLALLTVGRVHLGWKCLHSAPALASGSS